jgi:hypothetical protein
VELKKLPKADIEMGYEDGRLVLVTIRPTTDDEDGQLSYDELTYAARQILDFARTRQRPAAARSRSEAVQAMIDAYHAGSGKVTDEYLARLAVAYEELAPARRDVSTALAAALGKPVQTVKDHISKARNQKGYLSDAIEGKGGGRATDEAREVLSGLAET